MEQQLQDWSTDQTLSLEAMDALITEYKTAREDYEAHKKISNEKWEKTEDIKNKVISALKAAGKKSYKVDGVGTFSVVFKEVITVPASLDKKRELFQWIEQTHGKEVLDSMVSINYQTLNSFFKQEVEARQDPTFLLPGINPPTVNEEGRWSSAK